MELYLYKKLVEYEDEGMYPFHMPGHKRNIKNEIQSPYSIDITEIDGFDNLNDPNDILKQSMEAAAQLYGAKETFYLVNGSTVGILSAITATCNRGDKILMARNCHKAVYNAVRLLELEPIYIPLHYIEEQKVFAGIQEEAFKKLLEEHKSIKAVIITSPTYEGIVMHIQKVKMWIEPYQIPLIVDEAHGAHFPFCDHFPKSAITKGADIVIQSIHKTMPSFTQTALLHLCSDRITREQMQDCISIYQTSSPSYVLMAGIEYAIDYGIKQKEKFQKYVTLLLEYREKYSHFQHISLLNKEDIMKAGGYDFDPCKLVFFFHDTEDTGNTMSDRLRKEHHIQVEMAERDYIIAISTVMDTEEGFERLYQALKTMDQEIERKISQTKQRTQKKPLPLQTQEYDIVLLPSNAWKQRKIEVCLQKAESAICGEAIYLYPPGIPIVVPGERITKRTIQQMIAYKREGFYVKGIIEREKEWYVKVLK